VNGFFVTGGTMKPDAASYIQRPADDELFQALLRGDYCTVLTTRQMGKSSLMARTAARLRDHAIYCATADLQGKGDQTPQVEQWYYGLTKQIADGLEISSNWSEWWKQQHLLLPAQRLVDFFGDIALKEITGRLVIFVDEVDWMIRLPFSDEFFATIRSCYNRRAMDPKFDRLTFALLGSAAPAQLLKDPTRTPFNISRGIELTDFTPDEAGLLSQALGPSGDAILARILYWTDGHPYLTQMLCASVMERRQSRCGATEEALVDQVVEERLLSPRARLEENNLKFVGDRLTQVLTHDVRKVLLTYRDILGGKSIQDQPLSHIHTSLRLSGVAKPDANRFLQVRNLVYRTVFNKEWIRDRMPAEPRRLSQRTAFFSYSREDSEFVLNVARDLKAAGSNVWLDQMDILPGQRWDEAVERALAGCPRVLVVLSPASIHSTNVMAEVSFALEEGKTVIPILYRDCAIPFRLRRTQYIDLRYDYDQGLTELLRLLAEQQSKVANSDAAADVRGTPVFPEIAGQEGAAGQVVPQGNPGAPEATEAGMFESYVSYLRQSRTRRVSSTFRQMLAKFCEFFHLR
jgi:hypothetical protein